MTSPIPGQLKTNEQPVAYEQMNEQDYREATRPAAARVAVFCALVFVAILVMTMMGAGIARAATSPVQQLPAATLQSETETTYPGGDPLAEIVAALDVFGSLGTEPSEPEPPQGELPLLDNPKSVIAYCDEDGQATLQVAGIAPVSGLYKITYSPTTDLTFTLFGGYLEKGEKLWLVEPTPESTTVVVALQLPAEPDDSASPFTGALAVPTPTCG